MHRKVGIGSDRMGWRMRGALALAAAVAITAVPLSVHAQQGVDPAVSRGAVASVSGVVREQGTLAPIGGAIVTLQASGVHTLTGGDGSYSLPVAHAPGLVIVAARKGYFNRSALTGAAPGAVDIDLEAVPQGDDPGYMFIQPDTCAICHPDQFSQWNDSPMARAGLNTWVHDIYNGTGTPGGMGGFVYTRDSHFAPTNPNSECASCHQPELWLESPFRAMEGPLDEGYPSEGNAHGISCDVCHKIADVDVAKINFPGIYPGAVAMTRPFDSNSGQIMYGLLGDTDFEVPGWMRPAYQPQLMAEVCGVCHQDKNDPLEDGTYDGVISEPTYIEWADSAYSDPNSEHYANCLDCHMGPSGETTACNALFPPLERDPATIRTHDIRGTTPFYLENAAELALEAQEVGGQLMVQVDVTNAYTGHHLPTGVTVRNMILVVEAIDESTGTALPHTGAQVVHDLGGIGDPAQGYYAGMPGKFFGKVNHDMHGNGPTFFTDATGIQFDSRIPALDTDSTAYTFDMTGQSGAVRVRARLIYRRAFRFLVDAKNWTEDGHGNPLGDVQPPHYGHLMESRELVVNCAEGDGDANGDGTVDVNDITMVLFRLGNSCGVPGCAGDANSDGTVDVNDISYVLLRLGGGCV